MMMENFLVVWSLSLWMPFLLVVYGQREFDIRLVGGDTPREGRVEVFSDDQWGTICDNQWDVADADVVCKQLDLSYAISAPKNAAFGQGQGHMHIWSLDCKGNEDNISGCVRGTNDTACPHSQDASVICSDRGIPRNYDVRLIGGSQLSTGQVEMFLNDNWGILCSTPWSHTEADVVCRQSGYGGALISEGIIPEPINRPLPFLKGTLNCTKMISASQGKRHLFGCENNLASEPSTAMCEWPNTVACARHQLELTVRLFGGVEKNKAFSGRVEVSYGDVWLGICSEEWDLADATVVCHQLGFDDPKAFKSSATVKYPLGEEERFYLMSKVNCTGEETNIGLCTRVYGAHGCATKDFATVTCKKKGRTFNKVVITTALCLFMIPVVLLVVFFVVFCSYKRRKTDTSSSEQKSYSPVDQKESMELSKEPEKV